MRSFQPLGLLSLCLARLAVAEPYQPPPAAQVPGYFETVLPCKIVKADDAG